MCWKKWKATRLHVLKEVKGCGFMCRRSERLQGFVCWKGWKAAGFMNRRSERLQGFTCWKEWKAEGFSSAARNERLQASMSWKEWKAAGFHVLFLVLRELKSLQGFMNRKEWRDAGFYWKEWNIAGFLGLKGVKGGRDWWVERSDRLLGFHVLKAAKACGVS